MSRRSWNWRRELRASDARLKDRRLLKAAKLLGELADEQCGASASFEERSRAMQRIAEAVLSELAGESNHDNERQDPEN